MHINFSFLPDVVACIHNSCQRLDNKADSTEATRPWLHGVTQPAPPIQHGGSHKLSVLTLARAGLIHLQANTPAVPLWTNPIKIQKAPMQNAGVRGMTRFLVLHISPSIHSLTIRVCGEPQNVGMRPMPL